MGFWKEWISLTIERIENDSSCRCDGVNIFVDKMICGVVDRRK